MNQNELFVEEANKLYNSILDDCDVRHPFSIERIIKSFTYIAAMQKQSIINDIDHYSMDDPHEPSLSTVKMWIEDSEIRN